MKFEQAWLDYTGKVFCDGADEISYIHLEIQEKEQDEVIKNSGKEYRLVHAGLSNFTPDKAMDEYDLYDFLEERTDYTKRYYPEENIFLVTGHTPTVHIKDWGKTKVYMKNGHIALDCACVAGGKLAAFCIETEEIVYVDGL